MDYDIIHVESFGDDFDQIVTGSVEIKLLHDDTSISDASAEYLLNTLRTRHRRGLFAPLLVRGRVRDDASMASEPEPPRAPDPMAQMLAAADDYADKVQEKAADFLDAMHSPEPAAPDLAAHAADANRQMAQMLADERNRADRIEAECARLRAEVDSLRQRSVAPDCVIGHLYAASDMLVSAPQGTAHGDVYDALRAIIRDIERGMDLAELANPGNEPTTKDST